ncbi:Atp-binding protein, partial [Globisporangium polare]
MTKAHANSHHQAEPSAEIHHHFVQIETPKTGHDASKFHAQAPK